MHLLSTLSSSLQRLFILGDPANSNLVRFEKYVLDPAENRYGS